MRPRRQKTIALGIAGGTAVLLALVSITGWPGIEREYRLWRLRRDPALLERMLLVPSAGSRAAIERFVEEPPGREALIRLLLQETEGKLQGLPHRVSDSGAYILTARRWTVLLGPRAITVGGRDMECSPLLTAITGFLPFEAPVYLPDLREIEFQVRAIKEGEVAWPEWCLWGRAVHQSLARLRAKEDSGKPGWAVFFRRGLEAPARRGPGAGTRRARGGGAPPPAGSMIDKGFDGLPPQDIKVNPASRLREMGEEDGSEGLRR